MECMNCSQEGDEVFFEEGVHIYSGHVLKLTDKDFQIDSYGCCCERNCTISRDQIGRTIFLNEKDVIIQLGMPSIRDMSLRY